jgi:heme-degrading monooxygenase HmoA
MYAVIFTAEINSLDERYYKKSNLMRELAFKKYHCKGLNSTSQDNKEITISYWDNLDDINNFKNDSYHLEVQNIGKSKWYKSYNVEITEVTRQYSFSNSSRIISS